MDGNAQVIAAVERHHAAMVASLRERDAAVSRCRDRPELEAALDALNAYWREELLPHAAAEERSMYPAGGDLPGGRWLVASLIMEHRALGERAQALRALAEALPSADWREAQGQAASISAGATALFTVHAAKENEILLPALVEAGVALRPLLASMEDAFATARDGG